MCAPRRALTALAVVALLPVSAPLSAREHVPPDTVLTGGTEVRVTTTSEDLLEGRLGDVGEGRLLLWVDGDSARQVLPLADVSRVEVASGRHPATLSGALIGAGAGFGLGAVCAVSSDGSGWLEPGDGECVLGGTLVGALLGGALGTLEWPLSWRAVPTDGFRVRRPLGHPPEGRSDDRGRLALTLEAGQVVVGGPGRGLMEQLRQAGFDERVAASCFITCSEAREYPVRRDPEEYLDLTVRYSVAEIWAVGAGYGTIKLGGAMGYRVSPDSGGERLYSYWDVRPAVWVAGFWTPVPALRLGAGPARYQLVRSDQSGTSRFGGVAELGVVVPADRGLFVNVTARLHGIPASEVVHSPESTVTLRPSWTHATVSAGLGFRL